MRLADLISFNRPRVRHVKYWICETCALESGTWPVQCLMLVASGPRSPPETRHCARHAHCITPLRAQKHGARRQGPESATAHISLAGARSLSEAISYQSQPARTVTRVTSDRWLYNLSSIKVSSHHPCFYCPLDKCCLRSLMLGSQMRLPVSGLTGSPSLPLASPRHFGGGAVGGAPGGGDIEASIQNWRDNFLNKYHEQAREVSTVQSVILRGVSLPIQLFNVYTDFAKLVQIAVWYCWYRNGSIASSYPLTYNLGLNGIRGET